MSDFTKYLTETIKEYQYKIKFAGDLADGFQKNLKTALDKTKLKVFQQERTLQYKKFH